MAVRVKICGITRSLDAHLAVRAGAHSLGFVFYEPSPRYVEPAVAAEIISGLSPFITSTALFVDADPDVVRDIILLTKVDLLQFHGNESPEYCEQFGRPYIKALRMKPDMDLIQQVGCYSSARGILLDAYKPGVPGGTGESFEWSRIPVSMRSSIVLAGGLSAENVAQAIEQVAPYAVDVSGGVEASAGLKDANKIKCFFEEVARANNN
ncbi:phosphoribosylanthranilate isomerase [Neptunomonas qingdaonensis]|uniref:N-(5'-phosphoribosyl)anthranilate isomerase n=1 Tax=Neptunomonas qingdaonensis TaxID=1045558 RepID=A0A1I2UX41_9GAMM|nr:phosphoribosylanthranilate isomerase [Neptunomonas qingdaonensis]SFG81698.1 phosphoribosylanthranilate isomerase [Neptunomonas qingdaonensis]